MAGTAPLPTPDPGATFLERHRRLGVLLALLVLLVVGTATGTLVGRLAVALVELVLRTVQGGG